MMEKTIRFLRRSTFPLIGLFCIIALILSCGGGGGGSSSGGSGAAGGRGGSTTSGTATLFWEANTELDFAGYKAYYGTSPRSDSCPPGGYPNSVDMTNATSHTFSNLTNGVTYYFSITAYDTSGNESCFSDEVNKAMPAN
jgi:hypothetical protein